MKQQSNLITIFSIIILLTIIPKITLGQPPFPVTAPDTFTNPVLIIIPNINVSWGTLAEGDTINVSFYYVKNDSGKAINIVDDKKLIKAHVYATGKMHVRGDATAIDPKKQFSVTIDSLPKKKGNFLGMKHGGKHWVFNDCGQVDVTLMRNVFTFNLQQSMGQYAPSWKWFEVFFCSDTSTISNMPEILNNHYRGVYLNFDKIRFQNSRVKGNYNKNKITGTDALIQLNQAAPEKYFSLSWEIAPAGHGEVYEPKLKDVPSKDSIYIKINDWYSSWADISNTIYTNYVVDRDTNLVVPDSLFKKLRNKTDYASFATYFLINELSKDQDGYHKSTFMVKRDSVCYAGPFWDKNKSYGNLFNNPDSTSFYNIPNGWLYRDNDSLNSDANQSPQWWSALLLDDVFCDTVWTQWNRYSDAFLDSTIYSFIDQQLVYLNKKSTKVNSKYSTALERNNACWQNGANITMKDYDKQISQFKKYLSSRVKWMNNNLPILLEKSGFVIPNKE